MSASTATVIISWIMQAEYPIPVSSAWICVHLRFPVLCARFSRLKSLALRENLWVHVAVDLGIRLLIPSEFSSMGGTLIPLLGMGVGDCHCATEFPQQAAPKSAACSGGWTQDRKRSQPCHPEAPLFEPKDLGLAPTSVGKCLGFTRSFALPTPEGSG